MFWLLMCNVTPTLKIFLPHSRAHNSAICPTVFVMSQHHHFIYFLIIFEHLFFWLYQVLTATCRIFTVACRLSSCRTKAQLPQGIWDLSSLTRDQTISPALEGRFSTTGWPGKSQWHHFNLTKLRGFHCVPSTVLDWDSNVNSGHTLWGLLEWRRYTVDEWTPS